MERASRKLGLSVVKAGILLPIVQYARESGVPIEALRRRARLPASFGEDLAAIFGVTPGSVTYGRTALIYCNGKPAVELLEIVAPADSP